MTYEEYKNKRQEEFNYLPIFYAFSNEQFEAAMNERGLTLKDTDKIFKLGDTGGFYLKKDAEIIRAYFSKQDELSELMKDKTFATEAFLYEMNNHEYAINWQGDYDVCSCFCKCNFSEDKTFVEYLTEGTMESLIPAFMEARRKHSKIAENW